MIIGLERNLGKRHRLQNMDMEFRTWDKKFVEAGYLMTVSKVLSKYKLDLVGVQEIRWEGCGTEPAG
jgi:hypothetical protein